jgi:hypothetical protein
MKAVAPAALHALKEALVSVFWYRNDLKSFLYQTVSDSAILARINWDDIKRNVVSFLVETLAQNQERYREVLLTLIREVCRIDDFSHLEKLDGGKEKAKVAVAAVKALRKAIGTQHELFKDMESVAKSREANLQRVLRVQGVQEKLKSLCQEFYKLLGVSNAQDKGYALEKLLKALFELFDLDPRASFKVIGEQIDGAFTFDKAEYLLEARWRQEQADTSALDSLQGKLNRKLDNTLGVFVSINGFAPNAIKTHSEGRRMLLLIDGGHLIAVLEGRIELPSLLLRLRRHAATTGEIYLPITSILAE